VSSAASLRILHVEDDLIDVELIGRALKKQSSPCDIHVASTRKQFEEALEEGNFGLVISDTNLPGLDGLQVLKSTRLLYPTVPFVFLSGGFASEEVKKNLQQAGASACLLKSEVGQLVSTISQIVQKQTGTQQSFGAQYANPMELLVSVVQELSTARELAAVMAIVRRAARALTGADGATFVLRERDMCHYADEDAIAPLWKGLRFPMSACISGWAMLNRQPAVIEDIYADARIPHEAYRPTFVKSLVMVPIRTIDPVGAIGNYWAKPHQPTAEEVKLLQALADTTAVAMENVQVYAELEERVRVRSLELQEANRELEAFSYAVSHDLRAPVRHIHAYADILDKECMQRLEENGRHYVSRIRNAAGRMGELIEGLLALSHTSRAPLARDSIDLSTMAREILTELQATDATRRVEVVIADELHASGDARMIRVVLQNLLGNAWKFTGRCALPRIEVGSERSAEGELCYFVRDNGAGFDMAHAARLFDVFHRLHAEREYPGSGVGLATVQRVIRRHGGRIWANAAPGEGATFYFTLEPQVDPGRSPDAA